MDTPLEDDAAIERPGGVGAPGDDLEAQIVAVGDDLLMSIRGVIDAVAPSPGAGPQALARKLGVDKVLASRVLKATRNHDPMTATHRMPGPDPLRRLVRAAEAHGAGPQVVTLATEAIDRFEIFIRERIGDRSLLDAILCAWVPEARREFEIRRKQSAFKAISQLKGSQAETILATVLLTPSEDGEHIDVTWVNGLFGIHRLRPGVGIKISTRRMSPDDEARRPVSVDGQPVEDMGSLLLGAFCSEPAPALRVQRAGEAVHYTLAGPGFGPSSASDLVFAEVNRGEIRRTVPAGSNRKGHFFAEVVTPAKLMQFDVLVHEAIYPGSDPLLRIYDTSFEGVASVNDPSRDIDRLDVLESIEPLGLGLSRFRSSDVPRYAGLVRYVCERTGVDGQAVRGYRCRIEYPLYGSQVTMAFDPPTH